METSGARRSSGPSPTSDFDTQDSPNDQETQSKVADEVNLLYDLLVAAEEEVNLRNRQRQASEIRERQMMIELAY